MDSTRVQTGAMRFEGTRNRFDITSKRLRPSPNRLRVISKRFAFTPSRFDAAQNLLFLINSRCQTADVMRNAGLAWNGSTRSAAGFSIKEIVMSIPLKDSLLVPFSTNFNDRIVASPATFSLSAAQASAYTALHTPYVAAYNAMMAARADGTRSMSFTATKDSTKRALLNYARQLYTFVQANATVSDANKILLGIHLKVIPTPIPPPGVAPATDVVSVNNRTVWVNVHDSASTTKRGKPAGATAAWVYSFVGTEYPSDPSAWNFEGATTKPKFGIVFPSSVAGGTQVWLCAAWINAKQQAGPTSVPITTNLQGGGSSTETAGLKIAA